MVTVSVQFNGSEVKERSVMDDEDDEYEILLSSNRLQTNWLISDLTRQD
jgi:hypothetical protein